MRHYLALIMAALTISACSTDDRVENIKVEYTKNPNVVIVTDELLGMDKYRADKNAEKARLNAEREHFMLAVTIWAEARGEGYDGMRAVGYVIANRMKKNFRTDGTIEGTVRWPLQFSCWNSNDPNIAKMNKQYLDNSSGMEYYQWETAKQIARDIMRTGTEYDITNGSLFYHAEYVNPNWADNKNKSVVIGQHIFYRKAA